MIIFFGNKSSINLKQIIVMDLCKICFFIYYYCSLLNVFLDTK